MNRCLTNDRSTELDAHPRVTKNDLVCWFETDAARSPRNRQTSTLRDEAGAVLAAVVVQPEPEFSRYVPAIITPDGARTNAPTSASSHSPWPTLLSPFMTPAELRRLARLGAETRLEALQREITSIHQAFPDLRNRRSTAAPNSHTAAVRSAVAGVTGVVEGAVTRRRPTMSRQARQRIAEAERKRWAEWRAKQQPVRADAKSPAPGRSRKKK
jgi:hypothetical protein